MKTAIKLLLIYLGIQILSGILALIPCAFYHFATGGSMDNIQAVQNMALAPTLLVSVILMAVYLWKAGYISREKATWSIVSPSYLVVTAVVMFSAIWLLDILMQALNLPDISKQQFDVMQSGWIGIFSISILGPILEELLFRGAITGALLQKYSPVKSIVISALIFGVIHMNPVQIAGASIIGLLLAWVYYRSGSLIPCILMHIINNSLSVYLNVRYPEEESIAGLVGPTLFWVGTIVAVLLLVGGLFMMNRMVQPPVWKKDESLNKL